MSSRLKCNRRHWQSMLKPAGPRGRHPKATWKRRACSRAAVKFLFLQPPPHILFRLATLKSTCLSSYSCTSTHARWYGVRSDRQILTAKTYYGDGLPFLLCSILGAVNAIPANHEADRTAYTIYTTSLPLTLSSTSGGRCGTLWQCLRWSTGILPTHKQRPACPAH